MMRPASYDTATHLQPAVAGAGGYLLEPGDGQPAAAIDTSHSRTANATNELTQDDILGSNSLF